jgi:hypothetical protein
MLQLCSFLYIYAEYAHYTPYFYDENYDDFFDEYIDINFTVSTYFRGEPKPLL